MYHVRTQRQIKERRRTLLVTLVVLCVLCVACFFGVQALAEQMEEQRATAVRNAIVETALQCYAVEGAYPSSLGYLEYNYGLVVNRNDYVISYEAFASNVAPTVVVIAR